MRHSLLRRTIQIATLSTISLLIGPVHADDTDPKPEFKDGESQVVEAFKKDWIIHDLFVETEFDSDNDGKRDRMHVSVTRPKPTDSGNLKVPVIYQSSPYYAGMGSTSPKHMWDPHQDLNMPPKKHETPPKLKQLSLRPLISSEHSSEWVPRGFAVVHSSSPGTGLSQGCVTVGGDNESLAPKAVVDWLCGRAKGFTSIDGDETVQATWCSGKVGMIGTSYNGTLCIAAATTGVEGLECIVPVAPNTSYYHYYRSNGLVRHPGGYRGEDIDVLYNFVDTGYEEKRDYCDCNIRDKGMLEQFDRTTGDYNAFWESRDYLLKMKNMRAALLMAHGFNDWNVMPEHSYRIIKAAKEQGLPLQIFYHQNGHGGQPPVQVLNRWFTRYLHGIENGVEKDPKALIVREGKRLNKPDTYADYPNPDAKPVTLHPTLGGVKVGGLETKVNAVKPKTIEKIIDNFSFSGVQFAKAEWSNHRLVYATPKLKQSMHISGVPQVSIRVSSDRPTACLSVWLVSLPWTDSERLTDDIITRGWADPANAESIRETKPMVPGEFRTVNFDLQPDDQVIRAGEQIGLMIFSSDRDFTLWPEPGTQLQIDLEQTSLMLPIVGGMEAYENAFIAPSNDEVEKAN